MQLRRILHWECEGHIEKYISKSKMGGEKNEGTDSLGQVDIDFGMR